MKNPVEDEGRQNKWSGGCPSCRRRQKWHDGAKTYINARMAGGKADTSRHARRKEKSSGAIFMVRPMQVSNTIAQNCTPNQINKNNLRLNQLSRTKEAYGRYRNVYLEDYSELKMEIAELDSLIDDLSIYMQSTGRKYADHAATLRSWSARKKKQQKREQASRTIPTTRRKVYDGNDPDSDGQAYDDLCGTAGLCCRRWAAVLRQLQNSQGSVLSEWQKTVWA